MRLGGWFRLGIVFTILYGIVVAFVAYDGRPKIEHLESAWFSEAAEVIAQVISKAEEREVPKHLVHEAFLKDGGAESASWLNRVATSPSENQKLFSAAVARVNEKHRGIIASLPVRQREHWLLAFAWWVGGTSLLFGAGGIVRWVYRGFKQSGADHD